VAATLDPVAVPPLADGLLRRANLSDDQIDYQVRWRLTFMRFLGLGLEDWVPDAKTVWLYSGGLSQAARSRNCCKFDRHPAPKGYIARDGLILDTSIVPVQKNKSREENQTNKQSEVPDN